MKVYDLWGGLKEKTLRFERRYANGSYTPLPEIAAELVRLKVDVIVVRDSVAIGPAMRASSTIPIVMLVSDDPVADGRIDSLATRREQWRLNRVAYIDIADLSDTSTTMLSHQVEDLLT